MTARYQFFPWVRRGAASVYHNPDDPAGPLTRPDHKPLAEFPVELKINQNPPFGVSLRIAGPGDVLGIDPRVIIRTDPPARIADFEPNYLALIEFDPPDFPWLFTPAAAGANGVLRPWLVLVVVEPGVDTTLQAFPGKPLPVLTTAVSDLPDLSESWAWAHAQIVQPEADTPPGPILSSQPNQNLSRLICPRRLKPAARYLACLVPAFEAGRRAGLEEPADPAEEITLRPAWDSTQPVVRLPVYYHWEFGTGFGGDFESLADRLQGRELPEGVGRRPLRVANQPFDLPDLASIEMEGALVSIAEFTPSPLDTDYQTKLARLLNLPASEPVVAPPIYGRWQASQTIVPDQGDPPAWLRQINLDPASRAAAGLGTRVVQERQEQLVASAWEQLGDAPAVARLERRLEVAVAVLGSVVRRRVQTMETSQLVQFLGPSQARIHLPGETLRFSLSRQGLPPAYSTGSFRRASRPARTANRRANFPLPASREAAAERLGQRVPPVDPPPGTPGLITPARVKDIILPGPINPVLARYRQAVQEVQSFIDSLGVRIPPPLPAPFQFTPAFKASLVTNLDPQQTAPQRFYARISSSIGPLQPPGAGGSVISGPVFPQPMYTALRDLSPDFLLPGVGKILPDTVTLLKSNPRFIEAFMLGLNHEIAGELLWREFPGDLRHTFFSIFWDAGASPGSISQLPPIHTWPPAADLGDQFSSGGEQLVLLIRGELLQRYPDALIYAIRAKTERSLGVEHKLPLFRGRIEPDITFLGFNLTASQARGGAGDPGWFFAIQEQPSSPRFGLDEARSRPLNSWNDLGWNDLNTLPGAHLELADLAAPPPPGPKWNFNSAHMAAILRQRPVRVAIHARSLLPPAVPDNP